MNETAKNPGRIGAKDLINVGVFTVLYGVMVMAVLCPLVGGIPFMLFLTRVKKFGMITLMGIVVGCLMLLGGMGVYGPIFGSVCGLVADLICRSGQYASAKKSLIGYAVFSVWPVGNFLPIFLNREGYVANLIASGYGQEYADALMGFLPDWYLPVSAVVSFCFGILGGLIGRALLKKHFVRAGIA